MAKLMSKGLSPIISFDRSLRIPIHAQIADGLKQAIADGRIGDGTRLASTRVLADDWGVSRNTVLQVFETLTSEGFISSHVGDGTYVSDSGEAMSSATTGGLAKDSQKLPDYPFRGLSRRGRSTVGTLPLYRTGKLVPFAPNLSDSREFPMRSWLRLMNEVSGGLTGAALSETADAGLLELRRAIAHRVSVGRGLKCDPEQVIITSGSQQGLDLVLRLLTDRGEPVWIENPGYGGTQAAITAHGANAQFMRVDRDGACIEDAIQDLLTPRLICVSPARQFPTGATLSQARRKQLLEFANSAGSWILEDDFDAEFQYVAPRPNCMAAQDFGNRVILMATFSTTLVASLRMGYLIVPKDLIRSFTLARAFAHGHIPLLEQLVTAEMMNRGIYAAHVRRMGKLYRSRQQCLVQNLKRVLRYRVPTAECASGMHIVLPLVDQVNDVRVSQELAHQGIAAQPLSPLFRGQGLRQGLLLGFAAFTEPQLQDAAERLSGLADIVDRSVGKDWRTDLVNKLSAASVSP